VDAHPSLDPATVAGFGYEWNRFDQSGADPAETRRLFDEYFRIFPWWALPEKAVGFDLGCGSGRWAALVAPRVGGVVCVDASAEALNVSTRNAPGCTHVQASAGALPLRPGGADFGYSLGVLHHIPDPERGIRDAVRALKPGAPFLVYLYYAFDNRADWFSAVWRVSDRARRFVSRRPPRARAAVSDALAVTVYLPMARLAALLERLGGNVDSFPLSAYRSRSLYVMRTDALDRFGTGIEHRFTRAEVRSLLESAGLERVTVSDQPPHWCAVGFKPHTRERP
jgi:SAM-dependent methyltransferase